MKVRIKDIAAAAGVSPATVSNAFNDTNRVGEETKLKIFEIARKLGYEDPSKPALKKSINFVLLKKNGSIIIDSPFFSELTSGIEIACRKNQYELIVSYVNIDDTLMIQRLVSENYRPMLLLATEISEAELQPFLKLKAPVVLLDSCFLSLSIPSVHINNIQAGFLAGEHFIRCGHRSFGMVVSSFMFNNVRDRRMGYELALRNCGFDLKEENIFVVNPAVEGAYHDMLQILNYRTSPMPTAIFCYNDHTSAGVMRALQTFGLRTPEDVSLIGVDNLPTASMLNPSLTSIDVPKFNLGYCAVEELIRLTETEEKAVRDISIDVRLVERESVYKKTV